MTDYKESGVDRSLGDDVSKILYNAAKETWKNREGRLGEVIVPFDDFSGVRAVDVSNLPEGTLMNIGFDGIGTKVEVAERVENHRTMAYNLIAMVCDDAVVRGAEPVLVGSILDINSLKDSEGKPFLEEVKQLAEGYIRAAKAANVAIVNGEVAELGKRVSGFGAFNYNWGAAVVWFAKKERLFTGREIKKGDFLIGLREEGFRSNGISLVRKVLNSNYGSDWHNKTWNEAGTLGELVLMPSRIYCNCICDMFGGYDREQKTEIHGVAHITGGGLPEKLGRVLRPSGLGAVVDEPFSPSGLMKHVQEIGKVSDEEIYKTFCMGHGMVVISPNLEDVLEISKTHGIPAKYIGRITDKPGIKIKNKGAFSKEGEYLEF